MEIINSGNSIVDEVAQIHFSGNIVPKSWSNRITYKNGKPNLTAMLLLAEIVYWYRPTEERDENGTYVRFKKKFADELYLQKSYAQISNELGISINQAKAAVATLEKDFGLIKRHFRTVETKNGRVIPNVMYIELFPDKLKELTYGNTIKNDCEEGVQLQMGVSKIKNKDTTNSENTYPGLDSGTNTKNTYKDYNRDYINPSYHADDYEIARDVFKEQIEYDAIAMDMKSYIGILDGIVDLVVETLLSKKETVCISGEDVPMQIVKNKFNKLKMFSIQYVIQMMTSVTTQVKNPKKYLLATLYNAPSYEDLYWSNQVSHDMYGGDNNVGS